MLVRLTVALSLIACPLAEAASTTRAGQQIEQQGIHSCIPLLDRFVHFIHENDGAYGMFGIWSQKTSDSEMFATTTVEKFNEGASVATFAVSKDAVGHCGIVVTTSLSTSESCTHFRETSLSAWKFYDDLNGATVYKDPSQEAGSDVILSAAPNSGCFIVKRLYATE